jgi:hypothetical protein
LLYKNRVPSKIVRGIFWKKLSKKSPDLEEESYENLKIFVKDLGRFPAFFF